MLRCVTTFLLAFIATLASAGKSNKANHPASASSSSLHSFSRHQQFIPQAAFHCGYRDKYLAKNGHEWISDPDQNALCLKGKLDILKYCRRSYPGLDIRNIAESGHYEQIDHWCKPHENDCKHSAWVKPYRCIVGRFESEALLVPQGCHFGHVNEQTLCENFQYWNKTAERECGAMKHPDTGRVMTLNVRSFSILEPCGLDMFAGVEYVCCPPKQKDLAVNVDKAAATKELKLSIKASIRPGDDDSHGELRTKGKGPSAGTKGGKLDHPGAHSVRKTEHGVPKEPNATAVDPYLRIADPSKEHERYKAAIKRLQHRHREKVTKVMNDWSELETRYQEMKHKDPKRAETFRKHMTQRFQATVAALEAETRDERKQLDEVHQQRVKLALNDRKRKTVKAYQAALAESTPNTHKILKKLEGYIRTEEKDRVHAVNRYRHYLRSDRGAAAAFRPDLLRRLKNMDLRINDTLAMLKAVPQLMGKIEPVALEYWQTYRLENTPDVIDDSLVWIGTTSNNERILDDFVKEAEAVMSGKAKGATKTGTARTGVTGIPTESRATEEPIIFKAEKIVQSFEKDAMKSKKHSGDVIGLSNNEDFTANAMKDVHEHGRDDPIVREEETPVTTRSTGASAGTIVLAAGGVICLLAIVIGLMVLRRRNSAPGRGFVEVDATMADESLVTTQMQASGYENPTYALLGKE